MRCPACDEENPERAKFCLNCATPLGAISEPTGETRRVVTIVFADMAGSTAMGERLDPEALRRVQARYFDEMTTVIERHGGTVEKYIGDAVMAVFGIPKLHEDDPLRAVRAANEMQGALDRLNDDLERDYEVRIAIRIGVHTGEVVSSEQHADQRLVTGDTVNVAARLEQAAGSGEVLLGEGTFRLVRDAVQVETVDPLELKGKSERVPAFRLVEVLGDTAGHERHLDSPMVGRSKELELFRRGLERARDERTAHLFTLLGPAGVGKSRLVREFLAGADDATVLRGRCLSYGEGITYYALGEIVRHAAEIDERDDDAIAIGKLRALVAGADDGERVAQLVAGLFGWHEAAGPEDAAWGVRKLFEHLAKDRPLVVLFDDIHWAEPLLLDLIEHLADWTREAELLLVCVARPELLEIRPGWGGGKMNATSILLEPLAGDEASALLDNLLGDADLPATARDRILAAAEGNPLFVEEMIGMLIDDGLLRFENGAWRAVDDLADLTVPPTIQLLLAARLDRLDAEERAVIERGAVEGKVFHMGAVTSLSPEALRTQVRPRLLALARKELIRPDRAEFAGEDAFRFRHLLIRDAAYQAMPKEQRADLHEGFARWLTQAAGDKTEDYGEILGYHLEQAYRYRTELGPADERSEELGAEAAHALHLAADRARDRGDTASAQVLLERTIALTHGRERLSAVVDLGECLEEQGQYTQAVELLRPVAEGPDVADEEALEIRTRVFLMVSDSLTNPGSSMQSAREQADTLLERARAIGDERALVAATIGAGAFAFWDGHCAECRALTETLLPIAQRLRFNERAWVAQHCALDTYFGSLAVREGMDVIEGLRGVVGSSVRGAIGLDIGMSGLAAMQDDRATFDAAVTRIDDAWRELGDPDDRHQALQGRGESLRWLGRNAEAEATLREAKAFLDRSGGTGYNSTVTSILATFIAEDGRFDEAAELIENARPMVSPDDFGATVPLGWASALVSSAAGDHETAQNEIDQALASVSRTDFLNFHADTLRIRGMVLLAAGRAAEAAAVFDSAAALWEHKENLASLRRLRTWRDKHGV